MKDKKKLGAVFVAATIILYYYFFGFSTINPMYGWWDYYGWQLDSGKMLYRDIYCYLPPGMPWLCMIMHNLFGNNLYCYFYFGIGLLVLSSELVYYVMCKMVSPVYSMICVLMGVMITSGFLAHIPFDYNPIILYMVIITAFLIAYIERNIYINGLAAGGVLGGLILLKQTSLIYVAIFLLIWGVFKSRIKNRKYAVKCIGVILVGIFLVIAPSVFYLWRNETLFLALQQITHASTAKGINSGAVNTFYMLVKRFLEYGMSIVVITLSFFMLVKVSIDNKTSGYFKKLKINKALSYFIFTLIIIKVFRTMQTVNIDGPKMFYIAVIANLIYWGVLWIKDWDVSYKCKYLDSLKENFIIIEQKEIYLVLMGMFVVALMLFTQHTNFQFREHIYFLGNGGLLWILKRNISEIAFWFSLFWCIYIFWRRKNCEVEIFVWDFVIINVLLQSVIYLGTGGLDEGFSLVTVSFGMACLIKNRKIVNYICYFSLVIFIIFASVTQKQVRAYEWHGWISRGLDIPGVEYVESRVPGLQGFKLDMETELAYEDITSAINIYSTESDNVYEFPHSTLFNVLCQRNLGTFAVTHFFDVCPDDVFDADFYKIQENPPKMFIWVNLEEYRWKLHEDLFRNGKRLAARKMIDYYEDYIKKDYQLVYEYKNIYVWVKNPTDEQNIMFVNTRLKNSLDLHKR